MNNKPIEQEDTRVIGSRDRSSQSVNIWFPVWLDNRINSSLCECKCVYSGADCLSQDCITASLHLSGRMHQSRSAVMQMQSGGAEAREMQTQGTLSLMMMVSSDKMTRDELIDNVSSFLWSWMHSWLQLSKHEENKDIFCPQLTSFTRLTSAIFPKVKWPY